MFIFHVIFFCLRPCKAQCYTTPYLQCHDKQKKPRELHNPLVDPVAFHPALYNGLSGYLLNHWIQFWIARYQRVQRSKRIHSSITTFTNSVWQIPNSSFPLWMFLKPAAVRGNSRKWMGPEEWSHKKLIYNPHVFVVLKHAIVYVG